MKVEIRAKKIYLVRYGSEGFYVQEEDLNTRGINGKIYFALKGKAAQPPYFRLGINAFLKRDKADERAKELNIKEGTTAQRSCFECNAEITYGTEDKDYGYVIVTQEENVWECPVCGGMNRVRTRFDGFLSQCKEVTKARKEILQATNYTLKEDVHE